MFLFFDNLSFLVVQYLLIRQNVMLAIFYLGVFVFGILWGSFLGAWIYRLHAHKPVVMARSMCPYCGHVLGAFDLIPLFGFLFLKGRCRYCKKKISWEYFFLELATGLLFALFTYSLLGVDIGMLDWGIFLDLLYYWFIVVMMLFFFVYDFKHYLILDKVILPVTGILLIWRLVLGISFWNMLLGAFLASGFFLFQYLVSKGRWIGGGDIRMGGLMGVILGFPDVLAALFIAYLGGALVSLLLMGCGFKTWGSKIPFATFLTSAVLVTLLWGDRLLEFYFSFF